MRADCSPGNSQIRILRFTEQQVLKKNLLRDRHSWLETSLKVREASRKSSPVDLFAEAFQSVQRTFHVPDGSGQGRYRLQLQIQLLATGHERVHGADACVYGISQALHPISVGLDAAHAEGRQSLQGALHVSQQVLYLRRHPDGQTCQVLQRLGIDSWNLAGVTHPRAQPDLLMM
ncbi:hypothetical protein E2320_019429 [Naja naja]|nr:hypothetical protein E2320_019429 [Naja naja]